MRSEALLGKVPDRGTVSDPLDTRVLIFRAERHCRQRDVIGFLGLQALFIAHVTGNLVILAARIAAGEQAPMAHLLSVSVFVIAARCGAIVVLAAMLGVSAMAVQNALVQLSLKDAPSAAVMTTNLRRLVLDLGEVWFGTNPSVYARASARARRAGVAIVGFIVGAGLGAWCEAHVGLWSLALPTGLALVALASAGSPPAPRAHVG